MKKIKMCQHTSKTTTRKEKSGCISHRSIILVITAGRVVELETLSENNLILFHTEVD